MATLGQMAALNGRKVRITFTSGASVLATVIDVQDNLNRQVALEVQEVFAKPTGPQRPMRAGKLYAVDLEDIESVELQLQ